jgi:hypothetical protein
MMNNLTTLREFAIKQCERELARSSAVDYEDAFFFMQDLVPSEMSSMEHEMAIMHAAAIIDAENEFTDNFNVTPSMHNRYIDHISVMMTSDIPAWCRKFDSYNFWPKANRRITNLVYNWLRNSLDNPEALV